MIDTKPLEQQIVSPAQRELGIDDPGINELLALAEHNDILSAAQKGQALWEQGVFDVRTVGCYLGGVFMERGLASLPLIFDCVLKALTLNWEYLGPAQRKQRLCDVSLRWLFSTLLTQIEFHQRAKSEQWERWNQGWTQTGYTEAVERCVQLAVLLDDIIPGSRCRGPLLNLKTTLDGIVRPSNETAGWKSKMQNATVVPAPLPLPHERSGSASEESSQKGSDDGESDDSSGSSHVSSQSNSKESSQNSSKSSSKNSSQSGSRSSSSPSSESADRWKLSSDDMDSESKRSDEGPKDSARSEDSNEGESAKSEGGAKSAESVQKTASDSTKSSPLPKSESSHPMPEQRLLPPVPTGESTVLPLSPALRVLLQKLDGFLQLTEKREWRKAAILYRQLQQNIEHFDPRFYLPSLFGPFYARLAKQGPRLLAELNEPTDFVTEALVELCRVDFELFLKTELESQD